MPMKVASMNTKSMDVTSRPWAASARFRGSSGIGQSLLGLGVDDLAVVGDEGAGRRRDDLVLQIEGEDAVFGEREHEVREVARPEHARVDGHGRGEVERSHDRN